MKATRIFTTFKNLICVMLALALLCVFTSCSWVSAPVGNLFSDISKKKLNRMLAEWDTETTTLSFASVCYGNAVYAGDVTLELENSFGYVHDVFCVENERLYFLAHSMDQAPCSYGILSTDMTGNNVIEHRVFTIDTDSSYSFERLCEFSDCDTRDGYLYSDHKVLLKYKDKAVLYDIKTDGVIVPDEGTLTAFFAHQKAYTWEFSKSDQAVILFDTATGQTRTVTLESMAKNNRYAQRLYELRDEKRWDKKPFLGEFFCFVELLDGHIYFVCEMLNYLGESYAVVFQYDFENDTVEYVTHQFIGDIIYSGHYYFSAWYC